MAQLKNTIILGDLSVTGAAHLAKVYTNILNAPTTSNGTTYGVGTNGSVLLSNGTTVYWGKAPAATTADALTVNGGGPTQPIYFANGVPIATQYSLSSNVSAGTANRVAYYSANNTISAGTSIWTNGSSIQIINNSGYASLNNTYELRLGADNAAHLDMGYDGMQAITANNAGYGTLYFQYNSGNVQMGKSGSASNLTVFGNITGNKFHSNASASSLDLATIPSDSAIALETGNGNGSVSAWVWRESYAASNWGIFHNNSTDYLHFVGNNVGRLSISLADAKIGVNTTSPSYNLHVAGTGYFSDILYVGNNSKNNTNQIRVFGMYDTTTTGAQDGNDRPSINISGNYPQLVLTSTGISNSNHGPTISLAAFDSANATSGNFKAFTFGIPATNATYLELGYGENRTNPHYNGMSGLGNGSIVRFRSDKQTVFNGQVIIDNQTSINNAFNEGLRINFAKNNWAGIVLGGATGSFSGVGAKVWFFSNNNGDIYLALNESTATTYPRIKGNSNGWDLYPRLSINAGVNTSYNLYVNGNSLYNGIIYLANGTTYYINNSGTVNLNAGTFNATTESTSASTGSVIIKGGLGVAKNLYTTGDILQTNAGKFQKIVLLPGTAGPITAGWKRVCTIQAQYNYCNFQILTNGGWNSGAPALTNISIVTRESSVAMKLLHGGMTGNIQKIRLVKKDTNIFYLDVYIGTWNSGTTMGAQTATIIGDVSISDLNTTLTDAPSATAVAELELVAANVTIKDGTANRLAYYSADNIISAGTIVSDGSYLRNIGGYNNTSYSLSAASAIINSWIRTTGSTGWYNEDYDGGWYMSDTSWIRSYGSKPVYIDINSNNSYGIGTHRLALGLSGSNHVSIMLRGGSVMYGFAVNNDGNWYFGKRTSNSMTSSSGDTYLLKGNATSVMPYTTNTIALGGSSNRWKSLFIGTADSYGSTSQPIYWNAGVPAAIDWHIGNSGVGEHNANNVTYNFCGYYSSNGPSTTEGASTTDGALYAQAYSSNWVGQIAQDYRNGNLFVRGKNNNTWQPWKPIATADSEFIFNPAANIVYDPKLKKFTKVAGGNDWNTEVRSQIAYRNARITFKASQTNAAIMIGFSTTPTTNASYTNMNYCLYLQNDGKLSIYKAGTNNSIGTPTYATDDTFVLEIDGTQFRVFHNGIQIYNCNRTESGAMYLDSSFHGSNGAVYGFVYEPIINHYIHKATPSTWLDGQRYMTGAYNVDDAADTGSYHPWMRHTNTSSATWFSFGTLNKSFYIGGSPTSRTDNSFAHVLQYAVDSGTLYGEKAQFNWLRIINNNSNNSDDAVVYIENKHSSDWAAKINIDTYNYGLYIQGTGTNLLQVGTNSRLIVNEGSSKFNTNLTMNGILYFANGTTYYINNSANAVLANVTVKSTYPNIIGNGTGIYFSIDGNWAANKGCICIEENVLRPSSASSGAGMTLGSSGNRWGKVYIGSADSYGSTTQPVYWSDGVPTLCTAYSSARVLGANITTTANAVAYYTNTTGTFGSKASANGALYATSANGALQWGTLPVAQGGTGKTSWTAWGVVYASSTTALGNTGQGTSGYVLYAKGAAAPAWETAKVKVNSVSSPASNTTTYYVLGATGTGNQEAYYETGVYFKKNVLWGACWNDYAECRRADTKEPGRVIKETPTGEMTLTTQRLEKGCEIISDTYGFAIGENETAQTPTAATGRVLAYTDQPCETFELGMPVCSGPNGTVSQMTEEEARMYPWCIIGTVSEIPNYEIWHGGRDVEVKGRIWIRIR